MIAHTCPGCKRQIDVSSRITGDVILCVCGSQLRVQHVSGGTLLIPQLVAAQPRKRRKRSK